jgi:hypothetical protein
VTFWKRRPTTPNYRAVPSMVHRTGTMKIPMQAGRLVERHALQSPNNTMVDLRS